MLSQALLKAGHQEAEAALPSFPNATASNASQVPERKPPQGINLGEGEGDMLQPQLKQPISPPLRVPTRAASHPAAPQKIGRAHV